MRDLAALVVPEAGRLAQTGDGWEPYRLLDAAGAVVVPAAAYFAELQAAGCSVATIRSYGLDLLRWWRFLAAAGVAWDRATSAEARDFARWMQVADKRPACTGGIVTAAARRRGRPGQARGGRASGERERGDRQAGAGTEARAVDPGACRDGDPVVLRVPARGRAGAGDQPVPAGPLAAGRAGQRSSQSDGRVPERKQGRYRPVVPRRIPRRIPDELFSELFAALGSDRDRALLAFWVSTGARAEELLTALQQHADPGQQLITVTRKGSRAVQPLPASPDAFVWLRLYQEGLWRKGAPRGRGEPLWLTLRRPWRPLGYHAARAMFGRANERLGSNWPARPAPHGGLADGERPADADNRRAVGPGAPSPEYHPDLHCPGPGRGDRQRAGPP